MSRPNGWRTAFLVLAAVVAIPCVLGALVLVANVVYAHLRSGR